VLSAITARVATSEWEAGTQAFSNIISGRISRAFTPRLMRLGLCAAYSAVIYRKLRMALPLSVLAFACPIGRLNPGLGARD